MVQFVIKRDGTTEAFDADKLNKWAEWASQTCDVSWSDVLFSAIRVLGDTAKSSDIHNALIKTCVERKDRGHVKMAARLLLGQIYKEAFGDFSIPSLKDFYSYMVRAGHWDYMGYTDSELDELDNVIDHPADFTYEYATLKQFYDKYAICTNDNCHESPQMMSMGMAMSNNRDEHPSTRLKSVIEAYQEFKSLKINLPTPSLNGERTNMQGAPSCCVITAGDSMKSIGAATHVAYEMTANRSGIGIEYDTRSINDPVKGGRVKHTGKFPLFGYLDKAVKAMTQVTRGGSATVTFTCLDPEVEMLLRLKSQRTDPKARLEHLDYSIVLKHLCLEKAARNEEWMLVSKYQAPRLWDLMYSRDTDAFRAEYDAVFNNPLIKKTIIPARKVIDLFLYQRNDVSRIYVTFIDNVNKHTPFKEEIRLSNLCQEIALHTKAIPSVESLSSIDSTGEIALCFLASIVVSRVKDVDDYIQTVYVAAKTIDNTIERTQYPYPRLEFTAKNRRSIGVGMTDVAHWMAKQGLKYDTVEGRNAIHRLAELHSFALHKASVRLAKERGACGWFHKTRYSDEKPWLPIDTYSKGVDSQHTQELLCDWEGLRDEIKRYGMRFSVLEAYMPVESSSVFTASMNGVYPYREHQIYKKSKKGIVFFEAPGWEEFSDRYQWAYDIDHLDLVKFYAIIQKFTGQGISADFYTDLTSGRKKKLSELYHRLFLAAELGMKTWYYENFLTNTDDDEEKDAPIVQYDPIPEHLEEDEDEGGCESCKL
tara:strand:- start:10017 stop:12302 length:2286 start_codon:yes stop_codon:yes gene_type:complete